MQLFFMYFLSIEIDYVHHLNQILKNKQNSQKSKLSPYEKNNLTIDIFF